MDWQQKAAALNALAEIHLCIRGPDDWFVSQRVEIREEHVLVGAYGNGTTPEEAIEDHWRKLVTEIGPHYLVARPYEGKRRAVRWNGFMWEDYPEPAKAA